MSLRSQLRRSVFHLLNESLRGASLAVSGSLRQVKNALHADTLDDALRIIDRAWRCHPIEAATLAPIYGHLLSLEGRDHNAALVLLQRASDTAPDPNVAALIALAHLRLRRAEQARRQLEAALAEYCVLPDGLLISVLGDIIRHPAIEAPGWIGRGPSLGLVGELDVEQSSRGLEIKLDGQSVFAGLLPGSQGTVRQAFAFPSPQLNPESQLEATSRGVPLLGSGARLPANFGLDGRVASGGGALSGWARVGWLPTRAVRLRIEDEYGSRASLKTRRAPRPGRHWPFKAHVRAARLQGHRLRVTAQLPDGRWQPLPDSPVLLERAVRLAERKPARLPRWRASSIRTKVAPPLITRARLIDIVVPVFRGKEESLACIESVLATLEHRARVVVVDDATEDSGLAAALGALSAEGRITLLRNAENQGFVVSVNRALALHPTHDVVLLNSDTLVFGDWLARLRRAAYGGPAVGTATPLSNNGSIASYPQARGAAIDPAAGAALQTLAASTHSGLSVEIPVGVGFCLYVRRDCLREVGDLDGAAFGDGYGEEADFCLRARRRGWSHRLAADVFVYHRGGLSFGSRRAALLDRGQRLLNLRHPGYDDFVASFLAQDRLGPVRRRLDEHRLSTFAGRIVLIVTLAMSGGVSRFVAERCRNLAAQGLLPLLLRPLAAGDAHHCELWSHAMELPNLRYSIPRELDALTSLLGRLRLEAIELQHFLHIDPRVIEAVRALRVPYDVFVHDYAWICPRVTLIDGSGRYCGEPALPVCQACVQHNGSSLGEAISVGTLRERSGTWLQGARRVIVPSADAAGRLRRHFADLALEVRPPIAEPPDSTLPPTKRPQRETLRVALIGAIGGHKGYEILLACARDARARRLPIEFVVIGYTENDAPLLATGKVFITGRYGEAEAPHLIQREQPEVAWFPSVWPETWCYALDYALDAGLPIGAFDLGAIAERLRAAQRAVLMPLDWTPARINAGLLQLASDSQLSAQAIFASAQSQLAPPPDDDANIAPRHPGEIDMDNASEAEAATSVQQSAFSASVQVLPLTTGVYLFSVKSAAPVATSASDGLSLPAMHVGLGPGVRSEQVEFMAGPSTHGAWLFAQGDLLVTKIHGSGATLIMTSVRGPGGEVLSIKVERLDARAAAVATEPPRSTEAPIEPGPRRISGLFANQLAEDASNAAVSSAPPGFLPVQVGAHIRARGDMTFADVPWAGRVAPGLWIESFSVRPLERFGIGDVEYKGLTGSGFETPWISDDRMCGTKGMSVPLVGFAIRLKPSPAATTYDCEYSGYFQSGMTVGPLRNGAPCRSTVANDPLEGIQVRLVTRPSEARAPGVPRKSVSGSSSRTSKREIPARRNASRTERPARRHPSR